MEQNVTGWTVLNNLILLGFGAVIAALTAIATQYSQHKRDKKAALSERQGDALRIAADEMETAHAVFVKTYARSVSFVTSILTLNSHNPALAFAEEYKEAANTVNRMYGRLKLLGLKEAADLVNDYSYGLSQFSELIRTTNRPDKLQLRTYRDTMDKIRDDFYEIISKTYCDT